MIKKLLTCFCLFIFAVSFGQSDNDSIKLPKQNEVVKEDHSSLEPRAFRADFKKDYQTEDFQYEPIIKKDLSQWERFKAWLAYWFDRIFSFGGKGTVTAFEVIVKVVALLIVLFVVYLIVKAILNQEGNWIFGKSSKKKIHATTVTEEDIHSIDFRSLIDQHKSTNEYRLTIRYYYLWLLKKMSDNGVIEWDIEKTNSDYLYEIKREMLQKDFQYLSYIYDYCWYGEFTVDQPLFEKAEKAFIKTINSI